MLAILRPSIQYTVAHLEVEMSPEASSLDEVVVMGYGTQRKADLVDIESMNKQPSPQVLEQLQDRVWGDYSEFRTTG